MKKLMLALAVVAVAMTSQAAKVKWTTSSAPYSIDLSSLNGNGATAAGSTTLLSVNSTLTYAIQLYTADGSSTVGSKLTGKTVLFDDLDDTMYATANISDASLASGTTYKYVIEISGTQDDMETYVSDTWDYTKATISTTLEGTFQATTGTSPIGVEAPTSWTVAGAVAAPEPTSAMLLLIGVAGLALKRKRA